jgi:pilus assembly protein Flp/PilA
MADRITRNMQVLKGLGCFAKDRSGSTAIEYALIAAGISTAILLSVTNVGSQVGIIFTNVLKSF